MIQIRSDDVSPEAAASSVIAAIRRIAFELGQGVLVTVEPPGTLLRHSGRARPESTVPSAAAKPPPAAAQSPYLAPGHRAVCTPRRPHHRPLRTLCAAVGEAFFHCPHNELYFSFSMNGLLPLGSRSALSRMPQLRRLVRCPRTMPGLTGCRCRVEVLQNVNSVFAKRTQEPIENKQNQGKSRVMQARRKNSIRLKRTTSSQTGSAGLSQTASS